MAPDLYSSLWCVGETSLAINPVTLGSCLAPHQCSLVLSCIQLCQILWHWHRWEHLHPLCCIYTGGAERLIMSPFLSPFYRYNLDSSCLEILSWQTLRYLWPQMQMLLLFWFCPEFSNRDKRAAVTVAPAMLAAHAPTPLLCLPNSQCLQFGALSHRYFKSCRLCEGRSPSLVLGVSLPYPTVWGSSRALTAGKGCARLRREAWQNKSPSQDASHSRTFPAIPSILPVLLCISYSTQCPTHICRDRGNQGSIPGASFTVPCACTASEPSLLTWASSPFLSTKPALSRAAGSDKRDRGSLLVWWIHPGFGEMCEDQLFPSAVQTAQPVWRARQPLQGATFAFLKDYTVGIEPCSSPPAWQGLKIQLGLPGEQAGASEHRGKKRGSCFSHLCKNNSDFEGEKIQVKRHGVWDKRDPGDVCSCTARSIVLLPKGKHSQGLRCFYSFTTPRGFWNLSREIK